MEADLNKMRRYMLHHRIATYAIVLFLVLITFILISISKQVENEQALTLDSQARVRTQSETQGYQGTCPASGMPARLIYNGSSSCYFGQYRSVSVRCNVGDRAQIIDASTIGLGSVCADKTTLEVEAKKRCGCVDPSPTPDDRVARNVTPNPSDYYRVPTQPLVCKRGVSNFGVVLGSCGASEDTFARATYRCYSGKKGTLNAKANTCLSFDAFYMQAKAVCKNETNGQCPTKPFSTPIVYPTFDPQ